jgi:toxin ParE1/3/4
MEAVAEDPKRPGSRDIPKVSGVRVCTIAVGRFKIDRALRVQTPRHLVVYRVATDGVVEIVGLVHDRMLLPRAARRAIRDADKA